MLHALGDPDAFPAAERDLRAAARAHGLPDDPAALVARAERWRPWRGYAAHLLWRSTARRPAGGTSISGRDHHRLPVLQDRRG